MSNGPDVVVVTDGDEDVVYTEGQNCEMCDKESTGVAVSVDHKVKKFHRAVCDDCHDELENGPADMELEFRRYE